MTEDVARRSIDWLHDHGCRVPALMGGEPLLRPQFTQGGLLRGEKRILDLLGTNGRLPASGCRGPLGRRRVAVFNFALDSWDLKPSLPKALIPAKENLDRVLRKQYVYRYMVFFNINICRNNLEDVRQLTDYAHDQRAATDYHVNETPMLEQMSTSAHGENPTYIARKTGATSTR